MRHRNVGRDLLAGLCRTGGQRIFALQDVIRHVAVQRAAAKSLRRHFEVDLTRERSPRKVCRHFFRRGRSSICRFRLRHDQAHEHIIVREVGNFCCCPRLEVHRVQGRILLRIDTGPVERICFRVDLATLSRVTAVLVQERYARRADLRFLAVRLIYFI